MEYIKKTISLLTLVTCCILLSAFSQSENTTSYKCMVQTINYKGEGAYIIASLINPEGKYEKTLYILGDDPEWFHTIDEWWKFFGRKKRNIDGITGPTLSGGARQVITFDIDNAKIDAGYKIRFESCVEDQNYFPVDLEIPLKSKISSSPYKGKGYVRYVRMMPN